MGSQLAIDQISVVVDQPTEGPSTRDGLAWDGQAWVEGGLAWQSGAWLPTDEQTGDIVNNATWLERRQPLDRAMFRCALFAGLLCLGALVLTVIRLEWPPTEGEIYVDPLLRGAQVCLVGTSVFLVVLVLLAVARLAKTAYGRRN